MPSLFCSIVACTTFSSKDRTVVSPTPPGTGVILLHIGKTDSVSTSPNILPLTLFIPTSTTTAPSFTISFVIICGLPTAATNISACFVKIDISLVLE